MRKTPLFFAEFFIKNRGFRCGLVAELLFDNCLRSKIVEGLSKI